MTPDPEKVIQALDSLTDALGIGECTCALSVGDLGDGIIVLRMVILPESGEGHDNVADIAAKVDAIFYN